MKPKECPVPVALNCPDDVAGWAAACFAALGLVGWSYGTDRAIRRLGCCRAGQRRITLSRYFLEYYLPRDAEMVRRTLLHELAHALAWERQRSLGHGRVWRSYCAALGIPDERATTRCDDFAPPRPPRPPRYALVHDTTGEVFRRYVSRPRRSAAQLRRCYIPGRREETLGHLVVRSLKEMQNPGNAECIIRIAE